MTAERAFRNSVALSLLLIGLALVFFSIGGVLAFVADIATFSIEGEAVFDAIFRLTVVAIALMYFFIGLSLIRSRPRQTSHAAGTTTPEPAYVAAPAALTAARTFSLILFLLGALLLFNFTPYGRSATLAAVMILAGVFGFVATLLYRRADPNVGAVGGVLAIIAAAMLLYAQLTVPTPSESSGTYGAWETTNLAVPPVLGPIAIMIAGACAIVYAYVRNPRLAHIAFLGLGLAGLTYGIGLCLVGLASVFDLPWYQFTQLAGTSMLQLLALTAGIALLVVGGVCCIVASLVSFVRNGRALQTRPEEEAAVPTRTVATTTAGTPATWERVDAPPPSPPARTTPANAVRDEKRVRRTRHRTTRST